tara:strand:- start:1010 stop:1864 length:855 start_codon:yes stop_codon:yes gene_type:complete
MSDIRVEQGLPNKPEVMVMAIKLGVNKNEVIGSLVRLWLWADQCTRNGVCEHDSVIIDQIAELDGLSAAMESVGWMTKSEGGFTLPRIERYTGDGRTSKDRRLSQQERSRTQTRSKNGRFSAANEPKNPTSTVIQPTHAGGTDRSTAHPPSVQNKTTQNKTTQNIHTENLVEEGGAHNSKNLSPSRYHLIINTQGDQINRVIDAIPSRHRRKPPQIKRAVAAAIDRGVDLDHLADSLRTYYSSDEGKGEFATWPSNWIDQHRYEEDPSAWDRVSTDESKAKDIL